MYDILIKFPSRGRPERFFKSLDSIYTNICEMDHFKVYCNLDTDDFSMNNKKIRDKILSYQNITIVWNLSYNKINAINRDTPNYGDIIMVMSDDMMLPFYGFDNHIRSCFKDGLDYLLHLPDQDAKKDLATLYIAGRPFMERMGYIYHPSYRSLWADNEIMEVAKRMGKYIYSDCPGIVVHLNPAYGHLPKDAMFEEQQTIGWTEDHENFLKRQLRDFDL